MRKAEREPGEQPEENSGHYVSLDLDVCVKSSVVVFEGEVSPS
jgi:hypothetical protein